MGRRPDHLRRTVESLGDIFHLFPVIAINDFGDEETNRVFKELSPKGMLIDLGKRVGHHPAVDAMYEKVKTPYILHLEDDWGFSRLGFIEDCLALLNSDPLMSSVCLRSLSDFNFSEEEKGLIRSEVVNSVRYSRLDGLHEQWHGYTFNPHLARKCLWEKAGRFSQFKKERHISRKLRAQGMYCAYLEPGACEHIGYDLSVAQGKPSFIKRMRKRIQALV